MPKTRKPAKKPVFRRSGALTETEKDIVTAFVADQPAEVTPKQVTALSQLLRRSPEATRSLLQTAKDRFVGSAEDYVSIHKRAAQGALEAQDFKVAAAASQWAIANISAEGERIIEKETVQQVMPKVMIGVKIGGLDIDAIQQGGEGVIVVDETE